MQSIAILLTAVGALITPFYFHALIRFRRGQPARGCSCISGGVRDPGRAL